MNPTSVIECLSALHQSKYVQGDFDQRGGVMLVAPPGTLKSTLIRLALEDYPDALVLSDLNINTLTQLKSSIVDQRYTTLGFGEFEKLYQRNPATANNIEAHIKALVEEGFQRASFEDQRAQMFAARCAVIGGITPALYTRLMGKWIDNGFARRFIFCIYSLRDRESIMTAIDRWQHIQFGQVHLSSPGNKRIPYTITHEENKIVRAMIATQPAREGPFVLCKKILCVLKWRHGPKKALPILRDFAESFHAKGARLEI
jgi:hypothetical protein